MGPAGCRARIGAQGSLASVRRTLTTGHLPFLFYVNIHSVVSSTQGLADTGWRPQRYLVGKGNIADAVRLWKVCSCLLVGPSYGEGL